MVVPYASEKPDIAAVPRATSLADFVAPFAPKPLAFARLPFNHPLYILYSSGTTGVPKCIVHGAGGVLLMHLKEHVLHGDVKPGDRLFYFTTCGWMMWNWLVSGLAAGATLLLYDGSPFVDRGRVLFDYADAEGMTHFGTSAKFIDALAKAGVEPAKTHRLERLRTMFSTGSPLAPEGFDYVYAKREEGPVPFLDQRRHGPRGLLRAAARRSCRSGAGEMQCRMLGMKVEVWSDEGKPARGREGRARLHGAVPDDAAGLLERSGRDVSIAPPTTRSTRTSGATATGAR